MESVDVIAKKDLMLARQDKIISDINERIKILKSLYSLFKKEEDSICKALFEDLGKSHFEAFTTEIGIVLSDISLNIKNIKSWSKPREVPTPMTNFYGKSKIYTEPFGKALILGPWNYPFQNLICPMVAAIGAGNSVVLRPSVSAPSMYRWFEKYLTNVFPKKYIEIIPFETPHEEVLARKYDFYFYTGGIKVGKIIARTAAENLAPYVLELGGKSPVIVDETANIKKAAKRIIWGKMINLGQTCIAPDYILVHHKVKQALLDKMVYYLDLWWSDKAKNPAPIGHIINDMHFERLEKMITNEHVFYGGKSNPRTKFIQPTILKDIGLDHPTMQEEIFGPIIPVMSFGSLDEAISIIDQHKNPLSFYIFSSSKKNTRYLIKQVPAGGITVNDTLMHFANHHLNFGGIGESGIGNYHGKFGFDTFTHFKPVLYKNTLIDVPLRYPPYNGKLAFAKLFLK